MSGIELLLLALALSMDAFAVSLAVGTHEKVQGFRPAFRLWFHFGLFQALMTIAGWFAGSRLEQMIESWDHWVVFGLLAVVGGRMVKEGIAPPEEEPSGESNDPSRGFSMISLSIATSLDALAVGISLGMLRSTIWYPGLVIGVVTAGLCLVGLELGRLLGGKFGKKVEVAGGLVLVVMAVNFLFQGLGWL